MTSLTIDPIFSSHLVLFVLTIVVFAVPWLVPVAGRSLTSRQRNALRALRTGTGLLLLFAIFRPSIVRTDSLPTDAMLVVLLDRSRSMTLPADEKNSRTEVQNQLYERMQPVLENLDESLVLKTLTYSSEIRELSSKESISQTLSEPPQGAATEISNALNAAVQNAVGKPLAGVVMIGDGVEVLSRNNPETSRESSSRDPQAGARLLGSLDVPLWTVAVGPPGDLNQVRDAEVAELGEAFSLFAGNETNIDFVVRSRALSGKALNVRLLMTSEQSDAPTIEMATRTITPNGPEETIPMSIPITAPAAGNYRMELRIEPQEGETLLSNNSQVAFVDVRTGGGRVLYLEGQPRPEQAFLLRSLRRFPDLQVTYRWIANDTKNRWPIDVNLNNTTNPFDVVIIGDLPAAALGDEQLRLIGEAVNKGAALLMIGGIETFASGGYHTSPLKDVMPVKLDPRESDLEGDVKLTAAMVHPITSIGNSDQLDETTKLWNQLPPLVGASRFSDVRVAPGIEVLLETADGDPLLVVGEYGGGRVAAFAGDSTWRWWRQGKSLEHRRFWRQMMLWLLNRESDSSASIDIAMTRRRAEIGQAIDFTIRYPLQEGTAPAELIVEIIDANDKVTALPSSSLTRSESNEQMQLDGKLADLTPGMYRLRASFAGATTSAEKSFQILDQEAELRQPFADHTYLAQLSMQTAAAGGAMFLPDEIDELINVITQLRRNSQAPVVQKYRLGDTPTSAWPLFIGLTTLLGIEWYLRRRWGLA
jgi:uncharacterized membrane protein